MDWLAAYLTHALAFAFGFLLCAVFAAGARGEAAGGALSAGSRARTVCGHEGQGQSPEGRSGDGGEAGR